MSAFLVKPNSNKNDMHFHLSRKIFFISLVFITIFAGASFYYLLFYSPVSDSSSFLIDMDQIRNLAIDDEQELPIKINAVIIAEGSYPKGIIVAGSGFKPQRMIIPVYQIIYSDKTIFVDSAMDRSSFDNGFSGGIFFEEQYIEMQEAMRRSDMILLTHEHFDHADGLFTSKYLEEIIGKVKLTHEQFENLSNKSFQKNTSNNLTPIDYEKYYRIAPGMVLIKAAGHSPGSQMIYIHLKNNHEFILVGDVVWNQANLVNLTGRSRLASMMLNEDPHVHGEQIRALYNLIKQENLFFVISHDGEQLNDYINRGLIGSRFD